jgi:glutamine amidotransferase
MTLRAILADYGAGNLRSVQSAFARQGVEAVASADPAEVLEASLAIVAGVGHAESAMAGLVARGLDEAIRARAAAGRPVLGICVGFQLLFEENEEGGCSTDGRAADRASLGLGLLAGPVTRIEAPRVPHMGWNTLTVVRPSPLLTGLDGEDVYFAHSFAVRPSDRAVVAAEVIHGGSICAAVDAGAIAGVQFHPERSAKPGERLLQNVLAWSRSA